MANNTNGKPVAEIRVGRITATIWQNTPTDEGVFYSVHITRLFRRGSTWRCSSRSRVANSICGAQ